MDDVHAVVTAYLADLGELLWEKAAAARQEHLGAPDDAFASGRAMGLYEAVSLMHQQTESFGLDRSAVSPTDRDPDRDLLGR